MAIIDFPTYYAANIGEDIICGLYDKKYSKIETLYCEVQWDWSLKISGPRSYTVKKLVEHMIFVSGVTINNVKTPKKFMLGFTDTEDTSKVKEFKTYIDDVSGTWNTK